MLTATANLKPGDITKLQHMVGARSCSKDSGYRNAYCSGFADLPSMERLVGAGLARRGRALAGAYVYHATAEGCRAAGLDRAQTIRAIEGNE